jgi:RimJ/RimL family protein N-acetyltransferase
MIEYRKLMHEDYNDIVDLCKDIWEGTDYLPELFHEWVDDNGLFLGAVDTDTNMVIGTDKYSVLYDGTGWLEGLRTHKDYRGKGIGKELALRVFKEALDDLGRDKINKIAFSTHISSVESIGMMKNLGFKLEQEYIFIQKNYADMKDTLSSKDFLIESWEPTYEEFKELAYIKRRNGILPFIFYFQLPTPELFKKLVEDKCFISVNGYKGLLKLKGEPHFIVFDESIQGINAFMDYSLLLFKGKCPSPPLTSVMPEDLKLIELLKDAGFGTIASWSCDYLYFVYPVK